MQKTYILSVKIWVLLVCAAHERRIYTYEGLAKALGMLGRRDPLRMAKLLGPIMHYCNQNELPPLTVLVVNQETGLPGPGLKVEGKNDDKDMDWHRVRVFKKNWHAITLPNPADFQKAAKAKRRKKP